VHDVISRIPELAVDQASGLKPTVSLSMALELLERLTISRPVDFGFWLHSGTVRFGDLTGRVDRRQSKSTDPSKYIFQAALDDFRRTWITWSLHPLDRNEAFLREYQALLRALTDLRPSDSRLRPVLTEIVGTQGVFSLGSWSCELPRNWKTRCTWQESPSDWAEFFIAIRYGCHTRKIKERLARANLEQEVRQAWAAYGDWLCQRPEAVRELEGLLQGLRIEDKPATAAPNGSLETPAHE
jgi:hypothetical protein